MLTEPAPSKPIIQLLVHPSMHCGAEEGPHGYNYPNKVDQLEWIEWTPHPFLINPREKVIVIESYQAFTNTNHHNTSILQYNVDDYSHTYWTLHAIGTAWKIASSPRREKFMKTPSSFQKLIKRNHAV